ncbi:Ketosamine-3-kinase [Athelia psychrophila]|uniref:protein-ribulosamine 3-kinase n=1 Tax=Athelia psychrophila TaxID=1759441 RepID=A0A166NVY2_9AGAM|nr:Ketosamine-3-kinase [Fibularhizoctonia sp. CBS 109695]
MTRSNIPQILLRHLQGIEPNAKFTGNLPVITSSSGIRYYAKVGSPLEQEQYIGEAESLKAMTIAAPGLSPKVLASGITEDSLDETLAGQPYFLSEYKELGRLTGAGADVLAKRLATELHAFKSDAGFGFAVPTFCGATRQDNGWYETWAEFYSELISGLLSKLKRKGSFSELVAKGEEMRSRGIPYLLGSLAIDPVLLHGDLWSGNVGIDTSSGKPVIFDPSSMFGHNEADLAISRIFGGFPASFYSTYHKHCPKGEPVDLYDARSDLYQAYHYLNHTVLFGGSYASSAMEKLSKALAVCPK